jgi:hypothetical protein
VRAVLQALKGEREFARMSEVVNIEDPKMGHTPQIITTFNRVNRVSDENPVEFGWMIFFHHYIFNWNPWKAELKPKVMWEYQVVCRCIMCVTGNTWWARGKRIKIG